MVPHGATERVVFKEWHPRVSSDRKVTVVSSDRKELKASLVAVEAVEIADRMASKELKAPPESAARKVRPVRVFKACRPT
jgi:hypothetical protein